MATTHEIPVNVVREEPAPCRVKLDIEVTKDTIRDVMGRVESEFRKHARIPGFREGKAPRSLLKRHYGPRILEETKDRVLRSGVRSALAEADVQPLTVPQIENEQRLAVTEGEDFVFAVEFDVPPVFELPDYTSLDLPIEAAEVEEEKVENFIQELLSTRVSYDKVDRAAQKDDLVKASYEAKIGGDMDVPASAKFLAAATETWVALREPEVLPGIAEALVGVEAGSAKDIEVSFPDDFYESAFAGKTLTYHVDIIEVHAASTPELTDEFARDLGAESAEDVRMKVRSNLEMQEQREKAEAVRQAVVDQLLDKVDFDVSPALHARESYDTLVNLYQQAARSGKKEEDIQENIDTLRRQADEQATATLKRRFILEKIADAEGIKIDPSELNATIQMMARYQNVTEKKVLQRLRESGRLYDLMDSLRANHTIQRIIELNSADTAAE
ncbi:MAG: trigger factor [Lentisphaeria bacterium]|nr:trigger factor [Lentisphaeria bacterium]